MRCHDFIQNHDIDISFSGFGLYDNELLNLLSVDGMVLDECFQWRNLRFASCLNFHGFDCFDRQLFEAAASNSTLSS
jgi:hypothetical protein